jgi:hypothetical protein
MCPVSDTIVASHGYYYPYHPDASYRIDFATLAVPEKKI